MKRAFIALAIVGVTTVVTSAQATADGASLIWRTIAYLQAEILYLNGRIDQTQGRGELHIVSASGRDLGTSVGVEFPNPFSGERTLRAFNDSLGVTLTLVEHPASKRIILLARNSPPVGYRQPGCAGNPYVTEGPLF